uniref:Matrix remodeling associated 5 n=1 Tax=Sinocyclocheilus grahami TaxID=75366 RepID=A0A672L0T0_SINGR
MNAHAGQDRKVTRVEILVSPPAINGLIGTTNSMRVSSVRDQRKLIDCETTGTPVPRVMWVLPENVVLPAPYYGSRMTVHRNGTLDIRSVRMTDAGQLACIARNEGGETKLVVHLDVTDILERPKLKSPKMESLLLTVGRTINLNCSFEGSPTPQLTWILLNGSPLLSGAQFNKFLHKSDGTLVISNPALSEAGTYRCLGRNAAGMVERTVTLMPGHKPEINNRYNSPVSIMNGQSLHLHCLSNTDSVHLAWTLPSGMVLNRPQRAGRYAVLPNGTLSIQQAAVHDRGSYTCRASNEYGSSLLTVPVIIIAYPPRVTSGPVPATYAKRGVAVQLNCLAIGIPKAEVAWETPDRTRLIVSPQPRLIGNKYLHPQGSLIIQNPTIRDAGLYRCTARNVVGVDSKTILIQMTYEEQCKCFVRRVMEREFPLGELLNYHENVLQRNETSGIQRG